MSIKDAVETVLLWFTSASAQERTEFLAKLLSTIPTFELNQQVERKRGRPRKSPIETECATTEERSTLVANFLRSIPIIDEWKPIEKRRPGRPRKKDPIDPEEPSEAQEDRSKSIEKLAKKISSEEINVSERRRGRPRKKSVEKEEAEKGKPKRKENDCKQEIFDYGGEDLNIKIETNDEDMQNEQEDLHPHMKIDEELGNEIGLDDPKLEDYVNPNPYKRLLRRKKRFKIATLSAEEEEVDAEDSDYTNPKKSKLTRRGVRRSIQCDKCCATFHKQSHYIDHLAVHNDDKLSCPECHGKFNTPRNLKRHVSLYHREKPIITTPPARKFRCPECNFAFTRKTHLKGHLQNQHQIDPDTVLGDFPCPVCGKKNFSDADLQSHLERKHLVRIREKKNECEECGRKFLKRSDLDNHMTTHTNIRRFMCEVCGFNSKRPQDLTRHRKLVHLKEIRHICQTCGKGFLSKWQMKSHQLSHNEHKGFPCPEPGCGKSFRCPNNLRQHVHIHRGIKYVCQYCGESYSRTAYLARHIKTNHLGMSDGDKSATVDVSSGDVNVKGSKPRKPRKTFQILDHEIEVLEPEPLELDLDLPNEDGHTQQVILHGFDDNYEGVIMEYIIGP